MRIMKVLGLTAASAALALAGPALAATTFSTNFDSTDFGTAPGFTTLTSYEGWNGGPNGIEVQYNNVAGRAFSGNNFVELDTNANSSMSRIIDAGNYVLNYWYSDRPGVAARSNGITVLLDGDRAFTSTGGAGGSQTDWRQQTFAFNVAERTRLTFRAIGTSDSLGGYIDSVSLSAVPEPTTWAMMIAGFGMMGFALRNRAKTKVAYA